MDARDIIKRPVITERSSDIMAEKKYTFEVELELIKLKLKMLFKKFSALKLRK
jgi:large subunit ribosomal protein L23